MEPRAELDGEGHETGHRPGRRPLLAGMEVREEDLEPQPGLHFAAKVVRVAAVVVLVLALGQFAAWWLDRPPGGAGIGLLVGDTIRLIVVSALLWAANDVIALMVKTHYDIRAGRILLARQTHLMREMAAASGDLPRTGPQGARRAEDEPAAHHAG